MARTVTVKPTQAFLHGRDRYEEGQEYEVSSEDASYFKAHGWVEGGAAASGDQDVTLDIENVNVSTDAKDVT